TKVSLLNQASSQNLGVVELDSNLYDEFVAKPRNYSMAILLTALDPQINCIPCNGFSAEAFASYLSTVLGTQVPVNRPLNYFAIFLTVFLIVGALAFIKLMYPLIETVVRNKNTWAAISLASVYDFSPKQCVKNFMLRLRENKNHFKLYCPKDRTDSAIPYCAV
ncbi:962_t:CDS:2, partial [Cetraspora pellucida]